MAHLEWISHIGYLVVGYVGGILTMLIKPVGKFCEPAIKYSFDKATELKELIVKIKREIEAFKGPPSRTAVELWKLGLGPAVSSSDWIRSTPIFSEYALDLKSGLELIRWYFLIRYLVPLPPKKNVEEAAELLPQLSQVEQKRYQEALATAEKIKRLLS
jgi:hypothetical protein